MEKESFVELSSLVILLVVIASFIRSSTIHITRRNANLIFFIADHTTVYDQPPSHFLSSAPLQSCNSHRKQVRKAIPSQLKGFISKQLGESYPSSHVRHRPTCTKENNLHWSGDSGLRQIRNRKTPSCWIFNFEKRFAREHRGCKCSCKGCTSERVDPFKTPSCSSPRSPR